MDKLTWLAGLSVRFWRCPVEHPREPLRETVRWIGDVAHCTEPGCGQTSAVPSGGDPA